MPRKAKLTYVVELSLDTTPHDERRLAGVFDAAKRLYNTVLQQGLDILDAVRADSGWAAARKLPRATKEQKVARGEAFAAVRSKHGFTEYSFHTCATTHKNAAGFSDRLGSHITQKIGTRVFKALEEHLLGKHGRPRFKGVKRPLHSIEGKNTAAAPRWDAESRVMTMEFGWSIPAKALQLSKDEWLWSALAGKLKYTRVVWRNVGETRRYAVQLVFDGLAPQKASVLERLAPESTRGGLDIGPSNLAWCTDTDAGVQKFAAEIDAPQKEIRNVQRKLDRQSRSNNPDNFDAEGRTKRGRKWVKSKGQRRTQAKLAGLQALTARRRKHAHGRDINVLHSLARSYRHDGVSSKSMQKNYGRSVGARAPGLFMSELKRKAARAGGQSETVNSRQLKTSQYDHSTDSFTKKPLRQRVHIFGDGRGQVQRDVYSAFLAMHAVEAVDADGVVEWTHDPERLEAAWVVLEPTLRAKGLFIPNDGSGVGQLGEVEGASSAPGVDPRRSTSSEAVALGHQPGGRTRRAAHAKKFLPPAV